MATLLHDGISRAMKGSGSGSAASPRGGGGRNKQMLKHWWHYFSGTEVAALQDQKKSMHVEMTILVERGLKIGLVDPDEQAHKWGFAFLLTCHYTELPPAQLLYDKLQDLKATWQSERRNFFLERVDAADDPPLPVVVVGINKISDSIPLRASSKLLKPKWASATMRRGQEQPFQACTSSVVEKPPEAKRESVPLAPVKTEHVAACLHIDDDEVVLKLEYELKLAKLRAAKSVTLVKDEPKGWRHPFGNLATQP